MLNPKRLAIRGAVAAAVPALVLASAGQAAAETPSTWDNTDSYSTMDVLLIYAGIPLLLFLVIGLFGWLTHTKKASTYPIRREHDGGVAAALAASQASESAREELSDS